MSRPMPSPRGTNYEGLTMSAPIAAYDAALNTGARQRLTDFLAGKLTDSDMAMIKEMISEEGDADEPDQNNPAEDARLKRNDIRARFARGEMSHDQMRIAMDAATNPRPTPEQAADFVARFPDAARVKNL